ncbi:hypothetical protein CYMTET_5203, partial [Cymbomonas tetramitiformis]
MRSQRETNGARSVPASSNQVAPEESVSPGDQSDAEELPLHSDLQVLLPPPKGRFTKYLPGMWQPPHGFRANITGRDSLFWALWWLWRAHLT